MAGKTIVVLGGGVGGLVASNELRKRLGRENRIVLVDRDTRHIFAPSFTWLMLGWRDTPRISRELGLLTKKGIEYVNAEALEIDPGNRLVKTGAGDFGGRGYCFLETGYGMAGYGSGNFYGEPQPAVTFGRPGRLWRFAKVLFEKWWLRHWF